MNLDKDIDNLVKKIDANANKIQNNEKRIHQNTGALEILHTFKADSQKFFIMWLITFICLLASIGCIILEFTKQEVNIIKSKIYLSEIQERILDYRLMEYSITKMAMLENVSESTIHRELKKVKKKIMKVI